MTREGRVGEPCNGGGNEKLGAIGVLTRIRHAQHAGLAMLQFEILIGEFGSIDGLPTST